MPDVPGVVLVKDGATPSVAQPVAVMIDPAGNRYPQHVIRAAPLLASSAPESFHVFRIAAASVYSVTVAEVSADGLLLLFDAVADPDDGAVTPVAWARVTAPGAAEIQFGAVPAQFLLGLVAVLSSGATPFLKTSGPTGCFYAKVN